MTENESETKEIELLFSGGFDYNAVHNLHLLEANGSDFSVLAATGNVAQIYGYKFDANEDQAEVLVSVDPIICSDPNGIGAVCVHPQKTYLSIAGKNVNEGENPKIYIYSYPSLSLTKSLSGGALNAYTAINFSRNGDKLATVGSSPDYTLAVWDWQNEQVILKCLCFSQITFQVKFNIDESDIATSGVSYIKMWKMEDSFTGLKLQGEVGKFGRVESSDIKAFEFLEDGKILSGSQTGSLILWEGEFVKLEFRVPAEESIENPDGLLPHSGEIFVISLINYQGHRAFVTAGADKFIKLWSYLEIDEAEMPENSDFYFIHPISSIDTQHKNISISNMIPIFANESWSFICSEATTGKLMRIQESHVQSLSKGFLSHSSPILSAAFIKGILISAGRDGYISVYDITTNVTLQKTLVAEDPDCYPNILKLLKFQDEIYCFIGCSDGTIMYCTSSNLQSKTNDEFRRNHYKAKSGLIEDILIEDSIIMAISSQYVFFSEVCTDDPENVTIVPRFYLKGKLLDIFRSDTTVNAMIDPGSKTELVNVAFPFTLLNKSTDDLLLPGSYELNPEKNPTTFTTTILETLKVLNGSAVLTPGNLEGESDEVSEELLPTEPITRWFFRSAERSLVVTDKRLVLLNFRLPDSTTKFMYSLKPVLSAIEFPFSSKKEDVSSATISGSSLVLGSSVGRVLGYGISQEQTVQHLWIISLHSEALNSLSLYTDKDSDSLLVLSAAKDSTVAFAKVNMKDDALLNCEIQTKRNLFSWKESETEYSESIIGGILNETISLELIRKTENDKKIERKIQASKEMLLLKIQRLRKRFATLRSEGEKLGFEPERFVLDPEMESQLKTKCQAYKDEVRVRLDFDLTKQAKLNERLKVAFLSNTIVHGTVLKSLDGSQQIESFEIMKFRPLLRVDDNKIDESGVKESSTTTNERTGSSRKLSKDREELSGWELRRKNRSKRKNEKEQLLQRQPDIHEDVEKDVIALAQAKDNLGLLCLRLSDEYEAPEDEILSYSAKKYEITKLQDEINYIKTEFNSKFADLKEVQNSLVTEGGSINDTQGIHVKFENLRREKIMLDVKVAELELARFVRIKELNALRTFDTADDELRSRLGSLAKETREADESKFQCTEGYNEAQANLIVEQEHINELHKKFNAMIRSESAEVGTILKKLFKRKVKLKKNINNSVAQVQQETNNSSDDDSDISSEEMSQSSEDSTGPLPDKCPEGCKQVVYDSMVSLRAERVEREETLALIGKEATEKKLVLDRVEAKLKQLAVDQNGVKKEIKGLKNKKQRCLNQLFCFVSLKLSQMKSLWMNEGSIIPFSSEIDKTVLVPKERLNRLCQQSAIVEKDTIECKKELMALKSKKLEYIREKKTLKAEIADVKASASELQLLKFGARIDLDFFDKLDVEMKQAQAEDANILRETEEKNRLDLKHFESQLNVLQKDLFHETKKNSALLNNLAKLRQTEESLDKSLSASTVSRSKTVSIANSASMGNARNELLATVRQNTSQIQQLKSDILQLKGLG